MRDVLRTGLVAIAVLALAPASATAARITIGSDLSAPATVSRSDPNDIVWWPGSHPTATIDVPVAGQAIIMRVKGGTVQPNGRSQQPDYDMMRFVVLRPQPGGTWRSTSTSVAHRMPVMGAGADPNTVSTFTSLDPLCVQPGDRIGLVSVGGFDQRLFPNGLPYQVFAPAGGATVNEFRAGGAISQGETVIRADPLREHELLMQVVIGTGSSARPTCGGTAPSGSDPGLLPEPAEPGPGAAKPRAVVRPGTGAHRLRRGKVTVTVRCGERADCAGALELRARGRLLGRRGYRLAAGNTRQIPVRISKAGRRMIRRANPLRVTAQVTAGDRRTSRVLRVRPS